SAAGSAVVADDVLRRVAEDAGALGAGDYGVTYLRKSAIHDLDLLVAAVDATIRGAADAATRHDRDPSRPLAALTRRQIDVLRLVALGHTNARIAEERGMTEKAVEKTIARAVTTLGIRIGPGENLRVALATRFVQESGAPVIDAPAVRPDAPGTP
ncbi:MAG: LuxR C-terminal-related transcriptional regulator, partial [Chloroflexota bacterium]